MNAKDCWRLNLDDMLEQELQASVGHLKGPRGEFYESAYYRALVDGDHRGFAIPSLRAGALVKVVAGLGAAALVTGGGGGGGRARPRHPRSPGGGGDGPPAARKLQEEPR